jgi:hypothetical protein
LGRSSFSDSTRLQLVSLKTALSPGSHIIQTRLLSVCFATKRNGLQRELPAISKMVSLDHGGFSSALVAEQVWPSASSPHFLPCASAGTPVLDFCISRLKKSPSQISILLRGKAPLIWHKTSQPTLLSLSSAKAYSIRFQPFFPLNILLRLTACSDFFLFFCILLSSLCFSTKTNKLLY